jgi:hypothetical protein
MAFGPHARVATPIYLLGKLNLAWANLLSAQTALKA